MIVICKLHKQFFIDEVTISLFYLPLWFLNSLTRGKNNPRSQNFSFVRDALNDTPASMSDFLYSLSTYQLVIFKASHSLLKAFSRFQFLELNQMLSHGSLSPYELVPVCLSCLLWATSLHSLYFRPIGFLSPPMAKVCPGPRPSLNLLFILEHPQPIVFSFMETVLSSFINFHNCSGFIVLCLFTLLFSMCILFTTV